MAPLVQAYSRASLYGSPAASNARIITITPPPPPTKTVAPSAPSVKLWPPNINTDYENLWPLIALRHTPPGPATDCAIPTWGAAWVKQLCVARSVYYKGTCAGQAAAQSAGQAAQITGVASQAGVTAVDMIAKGSSAIPIVGAAVGIVDSIVGAILAHHVQAVANEQQAECAVLQITAQGIPTIDKAVYTGQLTAQQGIDAHSRIVAQCKSILAPVSGAGSGGHPCNAGCCFGYWLDCLQDFAETYYVDLAPHPTATTAPGGTNVINSLSSQQVAASVAPLASNPATFSPAAQASVTQAAVDTVAPPSGSAGVSIGSSLGTFLLVAAAIVLVLVFVKR